VPDQPAGLRVLLVAAEASGGIGRHLGTLAALLPEHGIEVIVCAPRSTLGVAGLTSTASGGRPGVVAAPVGRLDPTSAWQTRRRLRELAKQVDVVHAHGLRAGAQAGSSVPAAPLVVTWHNAALGSGPARLAHAGVARYVARAADLTLAASEDLATAARRAGGLAVENTFVVAPALPVVTTDRAAVRAGLGVTDRPLVLAIGRLQAQKRFDVLVAAASGWRDDPAAPTVVIAGAGPDQAALEQQITATGAPVRLLGARDDVADLLSAADLVALPSQWEARALVAQEALRIGVPVVATAVGGLPQLVGPAALLVPAGDSEALRAGIEQVLADPDRRERMVALGRHRASTWPD
jgi:glycosyltransferase involved in cell wall biosynthesis